MRRTITYKCQSCSFRGQPSEKSLRWHQATVVYSQQIKLHGQLSRTETAFIFRSSFLFNSTPLFVKVAASGGRLGLPTERSDGSHTCWGDPDRVRLSGLWQSGKCPGGQRPRSWPSAARGGPWEWKRWTNPPDNSEQCAGGSPRSRLLFLLIPDWRGAQSPKIRNPKPSWILLHLTRNEMEENEENFRELVTETEVYEEKEYTV